MHVKAHFKYFKNNYQLLKIQKKARFFLLLYLILHPIRDSYLIHYDENDCFKQPFVIYAHTLPQNDYQYKQLLTEPWDCHIITV